MCYFRWESRYENIFASPNGLNWLFECNDVFFNRVALLSQGNFPFIPFDCNIFFFRSLNFSYAPQLQTAVVRIFVAFRSWHSVCVLLALLVDCHVTHAFARRYSQCLLAHHIHKSTAIDNVDTLMHVDYIQFNQLNWNVNQILFAWRIHMQMLTMKSTDL